MIELTLTAYIAIISAHLVMFCGNPPEFAIESRPAKFKYVGFCTMASILWPLLLPFWVESLYKKIIK